MTIGELIELNHEITEVFIEFRASDGRLMGNLKIGKNPSFGMYRSYGSIPDWCKPVDMDDFFKVLRISLNYHTDGKDYWGYNGKLPKEISRMEIDRWTCWGAGFQNGYELHVTVEASEPVKGGKFDIKKEPARKKSKEFEQITLSI